MATHEILHYVLTSYKWRFNEAAIFWFLLHFAKIEQTDILLRAAETLKSFRSKIVEQVKSGGLCVKVILIIIYK